MASTLTVSSADETIPVDRTMPVGKVTIMGVALDSISEDQLVEHVVGKAAAGTGGLLINPNVDVMRQIVADPSLQDLAAAADLVVADGMPVMWAARLKGSRLRQRLPMSEGIYPICAEAARRGVRVFLLGGVPGTAARAAEVLSARYPGLVAGHFCPPMGFEKDPVAMEEVRAALRAADPGVVFCALGFPKQDKVGSTLSGDFPRAWFIGCGGTFSMVAGDTPKAPRWMSRHGLEWVHRLRLEPARLFERYIVHDIPFALRLLATSGGERLKGRPPR